MPARWLLYAPFSIRLLLLGPAALLGVFNSLRDADVRSGHDVSALAGGAGWPLLAVITVVVLIVTAMLSGIVTYWHWTVTARGDDIVLTRGLLTRRTVAIERRRLRGVMVREPLAGRPFRAATLQVVLSGVTGSVRSALVPLGPRAALERFGREFVQPCHSPIRTHPRGAYRRRLRRSLIPAVLLWLPPQSLSHHPPRPRPSWSARPSSPRASGSGGPTSRTARSATRWTATCCSRAMA